MSQNSVVILDASGAVVLEKINQALDTLITQNSGDNEPTVKYAGMFWACTKSDIKTLFQRNLANNDWVPILKLDTGLPVGTGTPSSNTFLRGDGSWATIASSAMPIEKLDWNSPCFVKTGGSTMAVKAGTGFKLSESLVIRYLEQTAISMPTLNGGTDYSIWCKPDGTLVALPDLYSNKASAPVTGALRVGGWHQGLTAYGTTPASGSFSTTGFTGQGGNKVWTQADVNKIAGINEFSIWDLAWCCAGEQRGLALDPQREQWLSIYFTSTNHIVNGPSAYNTDIASGTVLPRIPLQYGGNGTMNYSRFSQYECEEVAASFGLHLPDEDVFRSAAFGVTEGQSLGGSSVTVPATLRQPGYTSRIGLEQTTGHQVIFARGVYAADGSAWQDSGYRGQSYGKPWIRLLGGDRAGGGSSGSRCGNSVNVSSFSYWHISLRCAGDHQKPAWARGSAALF